MSKFLIILLLISGSVFAEQRHHRFPHWRKHRTPTPTPTAKPTPTATAKPTPAPTATATVTATATFTPTATVAPTSTATVTPTSAPQVSPTPAANMKVAHGVFWLLSGRAYLKESNPGLNRSEVAGFRMRLGWDVLEPTEGDYDFQALKDTIALAKAHGKKIGLSVSAGMACPPWLEGAGAKLVTVTTKAGPVKIPWPWDPVFLDRWEKFLRSFGAQFDGDSTLTYVVMSGAGWGQGSDIVSTQEDIAAFNAAGGLPAWKTAYRQIGGFYKTAFPTTAILLQINPTLPGDDGANAFDEIADWFSSFTPNSGFMFEGWKANNAQPSGLWGPVFSSYHASHPCDFQQMAVSTNSLFGGTVAQAIANLRTLRMAWILEVYPDDFTDQNKQSWVDADGILLP